MTIIACIIYKKNSEEMLIVNVNLEWLKGDVPALSTTVSMAAFDHKLILT